MTPREFFLYIKGQRDGQIERMKDAVTVAFHGEIFARQDKISGKTLEKVLNGFGKKTVKGKTPEMTQENLWHLIRATNAAFGGTDTTEKGKGK